MDTQKVIKSQNIKVTKGDSAIQFVVKIQRNGQDDALLDGTIYTLSNLRLDGVAVLSPTGIVTGENEVTFLLGTTETEVVGTVRASVQMYHADGRVSTISFTYNVMRDLSSDYVPSESEKTLIESVLVDGPVVIGQAKDLVVQMEELIGEGVKGDKGDQGEQGIQGERGADGEPGPRGESGEQGDTGPKGNNGEQGIVGPRGENGTDGKDGLPGLQGEKGDPGERGLPGENGSDGKDGLPGPAGEDGERGIDGLQGPVGADGETGPKGADGLEGQQGIQGEKGADGTPGEQGLQGLQGDTGPKGTDGLRGERGLKGEPGPAPDVSLFATKPEVKSAMDRAEEAFTQANDGKTLVAVAVTAKGVSASPADSFSQLAVKIGRIESGGAGGNEGVPIGPATVVENIAMNTMNVSALHKIVLEEVT
ncbi:BppU family phage baseplate upper protein [Sporosarcina sp. FSL K6-5500]